MTRSTVFGMAVLALAASGCSSKFLIQDYFIPDTNKVVRASTEQTGQVGGGDDSASTVSYFLQVCDLTDGKATNCKQTLILSNVLAVDFWQTGF